MWRIFGAEIGRFSILVVFALVVFSLFWLYYDAWREKKDTRTVPLLGGLICLSLSFLLQGLKLETHILSSLWTGSLLFISQSGYLYLRVVGYVLIILGLLITPIEKRPQIAALTYMGMTGVTLNTFLAMHFALPILSATVFILYWRRASLGLESHLKRVALGFGLLSFFEILSLAELFRETKMVWLSKLVVPFGIISMATYLVLLLCGLILARWTWYYLLKRLSTQLFMLAMSGAVALSLVITGIFVTLLLRSVESESLAAMTANAKVISSLMEEKKERMLSEIRLLAKDEVILKGIESGDRKEMISRIKTQMAESGFSSMVITEAQGKVILKGENEEEKGASLSEDPFVKKALVGETVAGVVASGGVLAPEVALRVSLPAGKGVIVASQVLDNAFVNGVKKSTGLSITIYGEEIISATTESVGDDRTRLIGVKETNQTVKEKVWGKGEVLALASTLGENDYLSAYVPLKNQNNETVAALQVSSLQVNTLQTAGQAVQLTFMMIMAVMIILALPIYWVCQKIVAEWE